MFGIGTKRFNSSMTSIYLFLFILVINQFLIIHSFRLMNNDQNESGDIRRTAMRRLVFKNLANQGELSSSYEKDQQLLDNQPVQRRFCCMTALSGRKRSIRDLARKQIENHQA